MPSVFSFQGFRSRPSQHLSRAPSETRACEWFGAMAWRQTSPPDSGLEWVPGLHAQMRVVKPRSALEMAKLTPHRFAAAYEYYQHSLWDLPLCLPYFSDRHSRQSTTINAGKFSNSSYVSDPNIRARLTSAFIALASLFSTSN